MRVVLFVEGHTERSAVPDLLKRWADARLPRPVRIAPVRFQGWQHYAKDIATKASLALREPSTVGIGVLDLYGPTFYPAKVSSVRDRYAWAKKKFEDAVGSDRFVQHFAVHETEAWILAEPTVLPPDIRSAIPRKDPETVNFDEPPSRLLARLYRDRLKRRYQKLIDGVPMLQRVSPDIVYERCEHFRLLADDLLRLARG
ncbi:MAG: DUF4276 family protein [Thermoanaerobaculia bacterium]